MINPDTYVYTFGKHKGKQYHDVPWDFAFWAHHNVDWFTLPPDELERLNVLNSDRAAKKLNYKETGRWRT